MSEMLCVALEWLAIGVIPIPISYCAKSAAIPWKRLVDHRPTSGSVGGWFSQKRNLGLLCGPCSDDLVVLDFDKPLAYYQWLQHGIEAFTVRTRRGFHVYTRIAGIDKTLSMEGGVGEIKGSGYVLAPPSAYSSGPLYETKFIDGLYKSAFVGVPSGFYEVVVHSDIPRFNSLEEVRVRPQIAENDTLLVINYDQPSGKNGTSLVSNIKAAISIPTLLSQHTSICAPRSQSDSWLMAVCPLHYDKNPSMWINISSGMCGCFAPHCVAHHPQLDVINLYAALHNISNSDAISELALTLGL